MTQSPLCGAALTYTLTAATIWAKIVTNSFVEISASDLALAGTYSFSLRARDPIYGAISSNSPLTVTLVNPCLKTAINSVAIPNQTLYAWQFPALTVSTPFIDFIAEVSAI